MGLMSLRVEAAPIICCISVSRVFNYMNANWAHFMMLSCAFLRQIFFGSLLFVDFNFGFEKRDERVHSNLSKLVEHVENENDSGTKKQQKPF